MKTVGAPSGELFGSYEPSAETVTGFPHPPGLRLEPPRADKVGKDRIVV